MVALWISLHLSVVNRVPERRTSAHTPPAGRLPGRPPGRRRPPRKTAPPAEGAGGRGVDNQRVSTQGYSFFRFYHNLSMNTCNLGKVVDGTRSTPARALPSRSQEPIGPSHFSLTFSTGVSIQRSKRGTRRSSSVLVLCGGKIALLIAQPPSGPASAGANNTSNPPNAFTIPTLASPVLHCIQNGNARACILPVVSCPTVRLSRSGRPRSTLPALPQSPHSSNVGAMLLLLLAARTLLFWFRGSGSHVQKCPRMRHGYKIFVYGVVS